jgi:hypothetical protein
MDGVSERNLTTRRVGLCVLLPGSLGGAACEVGHPDGSTERCALPDLVSPDAPFAGIRSIDLAREGASCRLEFKGETFDIEDQRNWTDASFKIYSRVPDWPNAYRLVQGQRVRHEVEITPVEISPTAPASEAPTECRVPKIFVEGPESPMSEGDVELLRRAGIGCVWAEHGRYIPGLRSIEVAEGAPRTLPPSTEAVAIYPPTSSVSLCGKPILRGANSNFVDLNRNRPERADGVWFAVDSQVHAVDDLSIIETVEGLEASVRTARSWKLGPVFVGPVRLSSNESDPRLAALMYAGWLLRAIAGAARAGAAGFTVFRADGLVRAGTVLPAWHVLADLVGARNMTIEPTDSPPKSVVVTLEAGGRQRRLVANLTPEPVQMRLPGSGGLARVLDEMSIAEACKHPLEWREATHPLATDGPLACLALGPYAYARIDT